MHIPLTHCLTGADQWQNHHYLVDVVNLGSGNPQRLSPHQAASISPDEYLDPIASVIRVQIDVF